MENSEIKAKHSKYSKALALVLELLALGLLIYVAAAPFYPLLRYNMAADKGTEAQAENKDIVKVEEKVSEIVSNLPTAEYSVSANRLIIPKIGVNSPIVETRNSEYGLSLGSWHVPDSSTPDKGGNTVLTGHRFKYLPPNNLTLYLLDKMEEGDIFSVIWKDEKYFYKVKEKKIIDPTDTSILKQTKDQIVTIYTCHPIYSTAKRLVVIGEKVEKPN